MIKNYLIITGGAGFVGSNLIKELIKKSEFKIISIDNYSSGNKKNHIEHKRVKYIKGNTEDVATILKTLKNKIHTFFHFGEFSRIFQSFEKFSNCFRYNIIGTNEVFNFCLTHRIKLVYSATSATLGNKGNDKDLSPYAFTKAKNLELLENLKKWFNFKYEIIYFYNVYGPNQISDGEMATVIGIFQRQYENSKKLTVVLPGTQTRRFTHIDDTIAVCIEAWKKNKCRHYSISNKKAYSILQVAKMFGSKIKFLPKRKGERYASELTSMNLTNRVYKKFGSVKLEEYIREYVKSMSNNH